VNVYKDAIFPVLKGLDAETVHDLTISSLSITQRSRLGSHLLKLIAGPIPQHPKKLFGLTFPNEIGVAAGFDKDARVITGLAMLGFGHIEVGTITPHPQPGNPKPRIFRLVPDRALINRMGFPSSGVDQAQRNLIQMSNQKRTYIVGVSLGKQKETPLESAARDYEFVMRRVFRYSDYIAINVSSPNTPGLRKLQNRNHLESIVSSLQSTNLELARKWKTMAKPLLVKVSPDLNAYQIDTLVSAALENGISGIIATNTTVTRKGLKSPLSSEQGGLSGFPLKNRSLEVIDYINRHTKGSLPIIGVGGISSAADVNEMFEAGASLVQLYTGLIYEGPGIAGEILRSLTI
jgi:dihydroorotate dehydrogenase